MTALIRRPNDDPDRDGWRIFFGDVRIGTIAKHAGVPVDVDQWGGNCGFYPGVASGLQRNGSAPAMKRHARFGLLGASCYLADLHPEARLIPKAGTLKRAKYDQLLIFLATQIAQKHIPLMRKLLTEAGVEWTRNKLVNAYGVIDKLLADGRTYLAGDNFTVADAYVWATMWHVRSGAKVDHLKKLMAYVARVEARPSAQKALKDEAKMVALHRSRVAA